MSLTSIVLPSCNILEYSISLSILASIASDQVIIARMSNTMLCKLGSKRDHVNTRRVFICIRDNNAFEQTHVLHLPRFSRSGGNNRTRCLWHITLSPLQRELLKISAYKTQNINNYTLYLKLRFL
jgi:hypothetical protein